MADQPFAVNLLVSVGNARGHIQLLAVFAGQHHVLNAMTVGDGITRCHIQVADFRGHRTGESRKETLPILSVGVCAGILARGNHIEYQQAFIGHIAAHDGVHIFGVERRHKAILECLDLSRIVRPRLRARTGAAAAAHPQCGRHPKQNRSFFHIDPPLSRR